MCTFLWLELKDNLGLLQLHNDGKNPNFTFLFLDLFTYIFACISLSAIDLICVCLCVNFCLLGDNRGREQGALVRGGTRRTHCVWGVAAAASTSKRVAAQPVHTLLPARGRVSLPYSYTNMFDFMLDWCFNWINFIDNWSVKAIRRKTTGTGRMRYLRHVPRRFKTNFREGNRYIHIDICKLQLFELFCI